MPEPSVSSIAIYQLRVALCGVSPLVWRRLLVVSTTSIAELHEILQNAFGWSGQHLHRFLIHSGIIAESLAAMQTETRFGRSSLREQG